MKFGSVKQFKIIDWSFQEPKYDQLKRMAYDFLTIQPPSERSFSVGGSAVTSLRTNLHSESVRELMCLRSWTKLVNL